MSKLSLDDMQAIESGKVAPTLSQVSSLGAALAFDAMDLLRGDSLDDPRRMVARFRAPDGVSEMTSHSARLLARAAELGRIGSHLWEMLGQGTSSAQLARKSMPVDAALPDWQEGYRLGTAARSLLSPAEAPLPSVQQTLECAGIHVAQVHFDDTALHAVSLHEPGALPMILLNANALRVREPLSRRAILAHELCHVLHDATENELLTIVSRSATIDPIERRANAFAPAFIAPTQWLHVKATDPLAIVEEIATTWGFGYEGAVWHAKNARLISPDVADALASRPRRLDVYGFEPSIKRQVPESANLDFEVSALAAGLIQDVVLRAYAEGLISSGRAHEILQMS